MRIIVKRPREEASIVQIGEGLNYWQVERKMKEIMEDELRENEGFEKVNIINNIKMYVGELFLTYSYEKGYNFDIETDNPFYGLANIFGTAIFVNRRTDEDGFAECYDLTDEEIDFVMGTILKSPEKTLIMNDVESKIDLEKLYDLLYSEFKGQIFKYEKDIKINDENETLVVMEFGLNKDYKVTSCYLIFSRQEIKVRFVQSEAPQNGEDYFEWIEQGKLNTKEETREYNYGLSAEELIKEAIKIKEEL